MRFDKVLVTGGSGQLGAFVVAELMQHCRVSVLDIQPPEVDVPFFCTNITDRDGVAAATAGHDAVVQLAALDAAIDATEQAFFETNVQGLWNVLEASEAAGVGRVIVCSSVAALNIGATNLPLRLPVDVAHPGAPLDAYGLSKQVGETVAHYFARRSAMQVCCLRPALVMQSNIVYDVACKVAEIDGGACPPEASDPSWRMLGETISDSRSFVSPSDAACCFRAALASAGRSYEAFFVTAADTFSPLPTLEVVRRDFGVDPKLADSAPYALDPRASIYDISPTQNELDWTPRERWSDVLERVLRPRRVTEADRGVRGSGYSPLV